MAFLQAATGPDAGRRYPLADPQCKMGRHPDCEVHIDVGAVSRHHAQIVAQDGEYVVEDLKSRNGTYVNDKMIQGPERLNPGDRIRICDVEFMFHGDDASTLPPLGATLAAKGQKTVLIEDIEGVDSSSSIMSKLDVSSSHGRLQFGASPQAKLSALIEITSALAKALAMGEVLPVVLDSLFKIFVQADRGFVALRNSEGHLVPMWTKLRREGSEDTIRISRTIVNQVMESRKAILSADAANDERFEMSQSIADFRIRSMMCAPLLDSEGEAIGVLQIDTLNQQKRFQQEDLEVLASVAAQAGIAIDNARLHDEALKQREVERDLEVAYEVQRGFLPHRPPELPGYGFFNYYQPANQVGGDYYDYITLPDGRVAVIVADVVGHGIAAALLMAKLAAEARYSLASETRPDAATQRLNTAICALDLNRFVTMVMAVIDPSSHEVTIVNAGHMAPMYRRANGELDEPGQELRGLPLGITEGLDYEQATIQLNAGESLTMYTDGINECMDRAGEMYGIDRIRRHLLDAQDTSPDRLGRTVVDDVREFLGDFPQEDDMCLVAVGRE